MYIKYESLIFLNQEIRANLLHVYDFVLISIE